MTVALLVKTCLFSAFHDVSVYPKKELPFFILFTAGLCSFTALLALLTHQYPEPMGIIAKTVSKLTLKAQSKFVANDSLKDAVIFQKKKKDF